MGPGTLSRSYKKIIMAVMSHERRFVDESQSILITTEYDSAGPTTVVVLEGIAQYTL